MSNVKRKREWKVAIGAILLTAGNQQACIAVVGENIARHSADHKPHHCWIGIDYSSGKVYDVYLAGARPWRKGGDPDGWRFVHCKDGRTAAILIAVAHGGSDLLIGGDIEIIKEVTLPL